MRNGWNMHASRGEVIAAVCGSFAAGICLGLLAALTRKGQ